MNDYLIKAVQLDVNGICNSSCWFCPVAYAGNPKSAIRDMPLSEIENIFIQLTEGKGDFVDPQLSVVFSECKKQSVQANTRREQASKGSIPGINKKVYKKEIS
jgi:hypothetical protein